MRKSIFRFKFNKISNINKMLNRFLRLIIKKLILKITHFFQIWFIIDYYLKKIKKINIIILRKLKKKIIRNLKRINRSFF